MRGRNRKWFGTWDGRTVGIDWVDVSFKFCSGVRQCRRQNDAFVVVDIIECCTGVSYRECIGGENRGGSRRGSVNRKEGANCGKLVADFFFLNVEEMSDVVDHLLMRESHFVAGGTIRRGRGDNIRGVASAVGRGRGAGRNKDGRRGAGHLGNSWAIVWCMEGKKQVWVVNTKGTVDRRSFCKVLESQNKVGMRIV